MNDWEYLLSQAAGASTEETPFSPGTRYIIGKNGLPQAVNYDGIVRRDGSTRPYYGEQDIYNTYASASPGSRMLMFNKLVAANFLDPQDIGDFNSEIRAIGTWLNFANTIGIDKDWALDQRLTQGPGLRRGGGGPARTYQTSNTQDLMIAAKSVAQDTLGREISDEEAKQFAAMYQQQEVSAQKRASGGGTVEQPMSLETAARTFAQNVAPDEAAAYGYLGYMNKLFDMIGVR